MNVVLWALLAGCGPAAPPPLPRQVVLEPCHLTNLEDPTLCGTWSVWEDRAAAAGRKIALRIAVVPAVRPVAEPDPVFVIAGGPGQSAVGIAAMLMPVFEGIRETRDIVFIDQRGTGGSNPLRCLQGEERPLAEELTLVPDPAELKACRDRLDADLTLYTTPIAMDDLDEVREALGYRQVNLYGGSYGTRAGLVYMRQHGEHVRSATLDGVAPYDNTLFLEFPKDAQSAFDAVVRDCAADPACHAAFPDPAGDLAALLSAPTHPVTFTHPRTGKAETVPISGWLVASAVMLLEYNREASTLLPYDLARARAGDWQPLLAQTLGAGGGSVGLLDPASLASPFALGLEGSIRPEERMADAMQLSVVCTEDIPRIEAGVVAGAVAGTFLGDALLQRMRASCTDWPRGTLPDGYFDPIASDVPTLLLSGANDPVTPPRWAAAAAAHLSHAAQAVAPGGQHINIANGCGYELMEDLVTSGSTDGLDPSCMQKVGRLPFMVDALGPAR